jgi:hypothetical protein
MYVSNTVEFVSYLELVFYCHCNCFVVVIHRTFDSQVIEMNVMRNFHTVHVGIGCKTLKLEVPLLCAPVTGGTSILSQCLSILIKFNGHICSLLSNIIKSVYDSFVCDFKCWS